MKTVNCILKFIIVSSFVFWNKTQGTNSKLLLNKYSCNIEISDLNVDDKQYCQIELGNKKQATLDYELRSSNGMKEGVMTTTFVIGLNEELYDAYPLEIELIMNKKSDSPHLVVGTYDITPLEDMEVTNPYFQMIGNVISEDTYQNTLEANLKEDVEESFVLQSTGTNNLTISSVKNISEENSKYYRTGKQLVKGIIKVSLLQISTNQIVKLNVDFQIYNDWSISK